MPGAVHALILLLACGGAPPTAATGAPSAGDGAPATAPDLVLITVDGLRADLPGPDGALLPFAEAAFLEGLGDPPATRFRSAYTQSVQPYLSMSSLLTGRYPSGIPLCGRPVVAGVPAEPLWCTALPASAPALPQVLSIYGYETALAYSLLPEGSDLEPLFGETLLADPRHDAKELPAWAPMREAVGAWWSAHRDAPRFLTFVVDHLDATQLLRSLDLTHGQRQEGLTDAHRATLRAVYQERARGLGARVAALLAALPAGARDRWVVITSLNGLSLGETSGNLRPGQAALPTHRLLMERTTHVPLLVLGPGAPAGEVDRLVELVDIMPTLARLAGAVPPAALPGDDLLEPAAPTGGTAYAEFGDMLSLREGDHFLLFRDWNHGGNSLDPQLNAMLEKGWDSNASKFTLHDVRVDPMQERDLAHEQVARRVALWEALVAIRQGPAAAPADTLSWERVQALHAAGATDYW